MKRICTICARGGSKGVKGKNIRNFAGMPLIAVSILQALDSKLFDVIAVSSDSDEILKTAKQYGVQHCVRRKPELATDEAAKFPVIKDCVEEVEKITGMKFDTMVDLDATSPLRSVEDVSNVVRMLESGDATNIITGNESRKSPYFNIVETMPNGEIVKSKTVDGIVRRQDSPPCYDMNASIYAWKRKDFWDAQKIVHSGTRLYEMPFERSLDIDTEIDFEIAEFLYQRSRR